MAAICDNVLDIQWLFMRLNPEQSAPDDRTDFWPAAGAYLQPLTIFRCETYLDRPAQHASGTLRALAPSYLLSRLTPPFFKRLRSILHLSKECSMRRGPVWGERPTPVSSIPWLPRPSTFCPCIRPHRARPWFLYLHGVAVLYAFPSALSLLFSYILSLTTC